MADHVYVMPRAIRRRCGTLVIEDGGGHVVANVRSGVDWRWRRPDSAVPRSNAEEFADALVSRYNANVVPFDAVLPLLRWAWGESLSMRGLWARAFDALTPEQRTAVEGGSSPVLEKRSDSP